MHQDLLIVLVKLMINIMYVVLYSLRNLNLIKCMCVLFQELHDDVLIKHEISCISLCWLKSFTISCFSDKKCGIQYVNRQTENQKLKDLRL